MGCPNKLERGIEVFLVKLMVVKISIVVPIIIVMWDLKFIVELVLNELICVEKFAIGYTINNVLENSIKRVTYSPKELMLIEY